MRRTTSLFVISGLLTIGALVAVAPTASAKGRPPSGSSSLALVVLDGSDSVPNWGEHVTFDVSSTATDEPHVSLKCSQGGTLVYSTQTGYYEGYPWPWTQTMTLASGAWTGGDADCVASLYYFNGPKTVTGATLSFHVYA